MYKKITITIIIIAGLAGLFSFSIAQKKSAIGVRVMANNEHLPIAIWYEAQNFLKQGNPSYTQVDGYDALRDGRTVYASAINVICPQVQDSSFCLKGAPPSGTDKCAYAIDCADASDKTEYPNFYTNVYVISVSDEDAEAQDMFSQILKNWHFNTNINANTPCFSQCRDEAMPRLYGSQSEVDELQTKLRRDGRRISDVVFMQAVLENYKNAQGHYPTLKSGTYLENQTISKWPSWNETLGQELGTAVPSDPVNNFGVCGADNPDCYCEGYDANTCWDNKSRLFNGTRDVKFGMPESALVYYYKSSSNGASYEFNARWETSYIGGESVAKMQAAHSASNTKPAIARISAVKMSPNETKIVEAQAYDYNQFTEKIIWADPVLVGTTKDAKKLCSALASDEQCCIAAAVLEPNTKNADKFDGSKFVSYKNLKITAGANICKGKINLKVSDDGIKNADNSALESDVYVVEADVRNQPPAFPSGIKTYSAETVVGFNWEYSVKALDAEDKNLTYKILHKPSWLSFEGGGEEKNSLDGVKILGIPNEVITDGVRIYNFFIEAKDSKGGIAALAIALTVTNKNPVITDFPADAEKHITENENFFSYDIKASDADGHKLKYSITCNPEINCGSILSIDSATGKIISPDNFTVSDYGEYNFTIAADDGYGGVASKSFILKITPFCGNNVVENWVAGGIVEQCETGGNGTSVNDQYIEGKTCQTLGYALGDLTCKDDCSINTSQCKRTFSVSGKVKDYMTASNLSGAKVEVNTGNGVIKDTITDENGNYTLADIPELANYDVIVSKRGYANSGSGTFNLTANKVFDFILSGGVLQGAARFQLTWGSSPKDLDSHLKFGSILIYCYNDKSGGAWLDKDVQKGYGPENIRIETLTAGVTYKYFIHDFSDKNKCVSGSFNGAKVEVYNSGGVKVKEYTSTHTGNCYWYVFDMDDSGRITDKNTYQNNPP